MKIAFLGDSRFIGVSAAEAAVRAGHQVTVLHSGKYPPPEIDADYRVAALGDPVALRAVLSALDADVVIDSFAMTRLGAERACSAAAGVVGRVIVLSSQDVYAQFGHLLGHPVPRIEASVHESAALTVPFPFRGVGAHAGGKDYDKKLVEDVYTAAAGEFDSVRVLRLPAVYGHRDTKRRFAWIVDRFDSGETKVPRQGGTWRWTHGYVCDMAAFIIAAAEDSQAGLAIYNLGDRETPSMSEWVERIAARMQIEMHWQEVAGLPEDLHYLGPMACDFVANSERAWQRYAVEDTPWDARLDDMIAWLRTSRDD